jgi:tetratricopeptide (TPR) repeat protein
VVLTADHGEGLGQHNEETHACFLYDTTLAVPLIFRLPQRVPAGKRVDTQVRLIDIAPTILALLNQPALPDAQGVSLAPLISGERDGLELPAYAETFYPANHFGLSHTRSLRVGGWKYIHAPTAELYHVAEDPGELRNLAEPQAERMAALREQLRELIAASPPAIRTEDASIDVTPQSAQKLTDLGYISGGAAPRADVADELDLFEPAGADPKDYAEELILIASAMSKVRLGDHAGATRELQAVLARAPELDAGQGHVYLALGDALRAQGRNAEAVEQYRSALRANPNTGHVWTKLGMALAAMNRLDEALEAYHRAMQIKPVIAQTHLMAGVAYMLKGDVEKAILHNEEALKIHPNLASAYANLGMIYSKVGPRDKAVEMTRRAADLAPENSRYRERLRALEQQP